MSSFGHFGEYHEIDRFVVSRVCHSCGYLSSRRVRGREYEDCHERSAGSCRILGFHRSLGGCSWWRACRTSLWQDCECWRRSGISANRGAMKMCTAGLDECSRIDEKSCGPSNVHALGSPCAFPRVRSCEDLHCSSGMEERMTGASYCRGSRTGRLGE